MPKAFKVLSLLATAALVSGCTSYYRVTDVGSGKTYYTTSWDAGRYRGSGAAYFVDATTGKEVTLQSSEVESMSRDQFVQAVPNPKK